MDTCHNFLLFGGYETWKVVLVSIGFAIIGPFLVFYSLAKIMQGYELLMDWLTSDERSDWFKKHIGNYIKKVVENVILITCIVIPVISLYVCNS